MNRRLAAYAALAVLMLATSAPAQDAPALRERHAALRAALADNAFGRPIHVESSESSGQHRGDIYAVIGQPFARVGAALRHASEWCDVLILQPNVKHCEATGEGLRFYVGRKSADTPERAYRVDFRYDVPAATADYLHVALSAAEGPFGTTDYRIRLEATPLDANRSFLHLAYSYTLHNTARMGMQMYLSTTGRDKVGFSVAERAPDGRPVYVKGVRGVIERNTMRYYLALEAYLGTLDAPAGERIERRLRAFHAGLERYPRQLHELELGEYLDLKRRDVSRVQQARWEGRWSPRQRSAAALLAATAVNLPFGTLYAFSVLLKPVEALLGATRAEMSFVFGLATVTLVAAMNFAPQLYRRMPAAPLALACALCSALGLWLAASASSFAQFALGYGVLFGPGAGVLFIVAQQAVNQTVSSSRGLANGYVVSLYPLGAMLGAPLLGWAIQAHGVRAALAGLAAVVLAGCVVAAALFRKAGIRLVEASAVEADASRLGSTFYLLMAVFFLAAAAGLMVLSQAAAIVQAYGGATALAVAATTFITGAVGGARIAGGWLVDHFSPARVGIGAHLCSLAGALLLSSHPSALVAAGALGLIGVGYGIVSGLCAGAIGQYWHRNDFGRIAARLYVAWCAAAISLPVLAGALFDRSGSYAAAAWISAAINLLGVAAASRLPRAPGLVDTATGQVGMRRM